MEGVKPGSTVHDRAHIKRIVPSRPFLFFSIIIRTPSSTMIVGPSGPCHYCYAMWQPRFDRMKGRGIRFYKGIPEINHLRDWFGQSQGGTLLLDEGGNDERVLDT